MKQYLSDRHSTHFALAKEISIGSRIVINRHTSGIFKNQIYALPGSSNISLNLIGKEIAEVKDMEIMGGVVQAKTDLGEITLYRFNDTVIFVTYKLKLPNLTGETVVLQKTWRSALGDTFKKGTHLMVEWHGYYLDRYEAVRVKHCTHSYVINVSYVDPLVHSRFVINKVLLKKLAFMEELSREEWFRKNQNKIDFALFTKLFNRMAIEALQKKDHKLHGLLMHLQAHAESWQPLTH
jgi:hypothetical protein